MPKFVKKSPDQVHVGRGAVLIDRAPYQKALTASEAGEIHLDEGERPGTVKRITREVAADLGIKIRTSWADDKRVLRWKRSASGG